MHLGDDISNLLRTLGQSAGIYQDLAQYNASRGRRLRPAGGRPGDRCGPALQMGSVHAPMPADSDDTLTTRILQRLVDGAALVSTTAVPAEALPAPGAGRSTAAAPRLLSLFQRLGSRG